MKRYGLIASLIILLSFHLWLLHNLVFTAWPEMLTYPFLLNSGFTIYRDFIMPYPPLLPLLLELIFKLTSFNTDCLRYLTWLLVLIVDCNLFFLIRFITKNNKLSLFLLAFYIPIQSLLDGNMLWFDFATLVPISFGLRYLFSWLKSQTRLDLFLTVIFFSLATAIKQTTLLYFLPLAGSYLIYKKRLFWDDVMAGLMAFGLVWLPITIYLWISNTLSPFWLWNIDYPLTQWSKFPGYVDLALTRDQKLILLGFGLMIINLMVGLSKKLLSNRQFWILSGFIVVGFITVYPRFSFFHLQPTLFFSFLILGYGLGQLKGIFKLSAVSLLIIELVLVLKFQLPTSLGPNKIRFDGPEDQQLTNQLKDYLKPGDKVYLLGLSSLQYLKTGALPTKPWADNFGWYLEIPGVQSSVISGLISERPKVVVWQKPLVGNWYDLGVYQPRQIVSFINKSYIQSDDLINGVEIWIRKD